MKTKLSKFICLRVHMEFNQRQKTVGIIGEDKQKD